MPQRELHLAAYDISEPRRLVAALKLTRAYATGGQKSVHELYLTPAERGALVEDIMSLLLLDRAQLEVKSEGDTLVLYEAGVRRGTVLMSPRSPRPYTGQPARLRGCRRPCLLCRTGRRVCPAPELQWAQPPPAARSGQRLPVIELHHVACAFKYPP